MMHFRATFRRNLLIVSALLAAAVATPVRPVAAAVETYEIDPVHSTVGFRIRHLGISWVNGSFADMQGTITVDTENPENSRTEVTVQAASVDTRNKKRDDHLRNPDFFNIEKFTTLTFKSTAVKKIDDTSYEVTGDLTILGTTRPITFTFADLGVATGMKGEARRGGETSFKIKRSDFGMKESLGPVGDEVQVSLAFSAIKK